MPSSECTETVTADEAEPRPEGTYRQDEIVKLLTAHYYMKAGKVIKVQQVITFTE